MPSFKFQFRAAKSEGQIKAGILANLTVELWADSLCIVRSPGWCVRNGDNGPWAASPGYSYEDKTGKKQFGKYVVFFPKIEGSDTSIAEKEYAKFTQEFLKAYDAFKAGGGESTSYAPAPQVGESLAPAPRRAPTPPPAAGPVLPKGWQRLYHDGEKKFYFASVDGSQSFWEDSDEARKLLASVGPPPAPRAPAAPPRLSAPVPAADPVPSAPDNPFDEVSSGFPFSPPVPKRS